MNLNKAIIVGRLTRDPEARQTASGQSVTNFGVATNRVWYDQNRQKQESTEFHNVVLWGRQAEVASQFLVKGQLVLIEGRMQTREWEGKDGQKRRTTEIVGESMQMGPKPSGSSAPSSQDSNNEGQEELETIDLDSEPSDISPEDIPF